MWDFLFGLVSIIIIDLVVSGDNAMVIALASRRLPEDQRKKAIFWGTFGAVGLRIVLTIAAVYLLKIPFLQAMGGLFLIYVAVKLLIDNAEEEANIREGATFGQAIRTIIIADLILSMDNIFAVAAAGQGHLLLVIVGLAVSIPIIIWGSGIILKLMTRFPILIYAGAGVLGWTAGSMLVGDKLLDRVLTAEFLDWFVPLLTTVIVVGYGKWHASRQKSQKAVQSA